MEPQIGNSVPAFSETAPQIHCQHVGTDENRDGPQRIAFLKAYCLLNPARFQRRERTDKNLVCHGLPVCPTMPPGERIFMHEEAVRHLVAPCIVKRSPTPGPYLLAPIGANLTVIKRYSLILAPEGPERVAPGERSEARGYEAVGPSPERAAESVAQPVRFSVSYSEENVMTSTHLSLHYHLVFSTKARRAGSESPGKTDCTAIWAASSVDWAEWRKRSEGLAIMCTFWPASRRHTVWLM